jgi:hypothetical protein
MTKYKVSFISAKSHKREFLCDPKGNPRYYTKEKATTMAKILKERKGKVVKV